MAEKCPFCGGPVKGLPITYRMSTKQEKIFNAIVSAGQEGVAASDLMSRFYKEKSNTSLRTAIFGINRIIFPARIKAKKGAYSVTNG